MARRIRLGPGYVVLRRYTALGKTKSQPATNNKTSKAKGSTSCTDKIESPRSEIKWCQARDKNSYPFRQRRNEPRQITKHNMIPLKIIESGINPYRDHVQGKANEPITVAALLDTIADASDDLQRAAATA